jgi:hypothetical protein
VAKVTAPPAHIKAMVEAVCALFPWIKMVTVNRQRNHRFNKAVAETIKTLLAVSRAFIQSKDQESGVWFFGSVLQWLGYCFGTFISFLAASRGTYFFLNATFRRLR